MKSDYLRDSSQQLRASWDRPISDCSSEGHNLCPLALLGSRLILWPGWPLPFPRNHLGFLFGNTRFHTADGLAGTSLGSTLWLSEQAHGCLERCTQPGFGAVVVS